jgi:hypothetical protein
MDRLSWFTLKNVLLALLSLSSRGAKRRSDLVFGEEKMELLRPSSARLSLPKAGSKTGQKIGSV